MKNIQFASDRNPKGCGIIAIVNTGIVSKAIMPVGPHNFPSEDAAIASFLKGLGDTIKPGRP